MAFDPSTLAALGWRHTHTYDSCDVAAVRKALQQRNGIAGLETVSPTQPGYAARAADLFHRDGYVVVTDSLPTGRCHAPSPQHCQHCRQPSLCQSWVLCY